MDNLNQTENTTRDFNVSVDCAVIRQKITDTLKEWAGHGSSVGFDGMWHGYEALSDATGITILDCKKEIKKMRCDGIVELKPTYNTSFGMCGSGYFLSV